MTPPCPSVERLRGLLASGLGADDEALVAHLDGCATCRLRLEALAGAPGTWGGLPSRMGNSPQPEEPALREVMDNLRDGHHATEGNAAVPLPRKLGPYLVEGLIGQGSMGRVVKAFHPTLRRVVAIKLMAAHLAANGIARNRFKREARAAAAIAHEHIVTIHGVDEQPDGSPYIVMEYVAGRSLQERLDAAPLGLREVLRIGLQVARGLEAAHTQGVVHRDVKPSNILLENGVERVKIADFGLAQVNDDVGITQSGVITGTPAYMSPEQARGEPTDGRSDLYSLGAVLYTLCAGGPPFRGGHPLSVLKRVCEEEPRPLDQVNPEFPEWLSEIIGQLLAKDPADRFQTAGEVAEVLEQHLAHLQHPAAVPLPPPIASASRPAEGWGPRVLGVLGVLAFFLVLAWSAARKELNDEWPLALAVAGVFGLLSVLAGKNRGHRPVRPAPSPPWPRGLVFGAVALLLGLGLLTIGARAPTRAIFQLGWPLLLLAGICIVVALLRGPRGHRKVRRACPPRRPRWALGCALVLVFPVVALLFAWLSYARMAHVRPAPAMRAPTGLGTLQIRVPDAQTRVVLTGEGIDRREYRGERQFSEQLRPGSYTLTADKDGQMLYSELVAVGPGQFVQFVVPEWGEVVFLPAGVRVEVDGAAVATRRPVQLRVGRHHWAAFPEGKEANLGEFFLRANERRVIEVSLPPR